MIGWLISGEEESRRGSMKNAQQLPLEECPHCGVSSPVLMTIAIHPTNSFRGGNARVWGFYRCTTCGGVVLTVAPSGPQHAAEITAMWPSNRTVSGDIPQRPRNYLEQAFASRKAPAGAIMLTASAVDSMLKDKGYKEGSLYTRIDQAATDHLITSEMALWAHEVRLEANGQRHVDENLPLPTDADSDKALEFATALGQFLYVLPAMVTRGRKPPTA
jgi:hypothetical protein